MRIDRLDLIAYGAFTDTSLDLSDGQFGLHLIYGDNEAGKSTSLRALAAWLFGVPTQTKDSFLHANPQLRIGGKLRRSDGKQIEFIRRKGAKGTLLAYGTGEPMDDAVLAPFLPAGVDESLFTKLWGIDHTGLVAGAKELLDQSGDLGQALFSAALGTSGLRDLLAELNRGAEEIFKPRATKKILNQAISDFRDAHRRIRETSLPVSEWKRLQKDLADTLAAIEQTEKAIESKSREKSRLNRLNRVKGALAERRSVIARIDELGEVLLLPEDFQEKTKAAADRFKAAAEKKERGEAKLSRLKEESESLTIRTELLENEEEIEALHKNLGAVETSIKDRPQQDGKRRLLRNEAETLLKGIRPDLDLEKADALRPLLNNGKWISGLVKKHDLLAQKTEGTQSTLGKIEEAKASFGKTLGQLPRSKLDLRELKALIAAARKAGDVEPRLTELGKRACDERAACTDELARLGRFTGTLPSLMRLAMPVSETLDAFEKENDGLAEKLRDARREQRRIEEDMQQAAQDLKALLLKSDVPTVSDLEQSRRTRNAGWNLIKRKYIDLVDLEKEISAFAPGADLARVYEQKVEQADHVSDRLRLGADQVVKRADLEAKIENLKSRSGEIAREIENLDAARKDHRERWGALWKPLEVDAGTPREMKQWLLRVDNLVTRAQVADAVAAEERNLAEACDRLKAALSGQIAKFDDSTDTQAMDLETMISLCEQRVEEEEAIRDQRRRLEQSLSDAESRLKTARDELKSIETDQSSWRQEWHQALQGLGLEKGCHPEQATETFDRLESFFEKFDKSEELRKRIYGMDQVEEKFEKKVFEFSDRISFNREGLPAAVVVVQLNRELNIAREARVSMNAIEKQLKEIMDEISQAEITIRTAGRELGELKEQAGVATDDDLLAAGERSQNLRELQKQLDSIERELIRSGDGLGIEALEEEFDRMETDAIEGELEKASVELRDLQATRDDLRDRRQTLQYEIEAKDGSSAAAAASEEAQEHLAGMVLHAEKYLRLKIAALILGQRIENYRRKNQAPVLARSGELFSTLTLGSYARLRDELDNSGRPILLGVRPNDEEVTVEGMSDGSRDQLYLALRLATLEQHLSQGEPMPFVVDDILIGFDDRRTRICLELLAKLADRTQVLLFTHHRRVIELAEGIDAKAGVYLHELA